MAQSLWSLCEAAGDYSFNKSHAACYALLAYRTAYLKANHPAEYMASLLSSVMDTKDRVPFYVAACTEMGLAVLPPDVNVSGADFAVTGEREIRFGLTAIKGVGENAVAAIIAARDAGGPFESIWDFCRRVDQAQVNKRALESLIRGGALDSTGATRLGMLEAIPAAVGQAARRRNDLAAGQESLFGAIGRRRARASRSTRPSRPPRCRGTSCCRREGGARPLRVEPPAPGLPPAARARRHLRPGRASPSAPTARR